MYGSDGHLLNRTITKPAFIIHVRRRPSDLNNKGSKKIGAFII